MRQPGICEICEEPTDLGICRRCQRAQDAAAERDRAQGITHRCGQCWEPNGLHIEGGCSNWRDDPPPYDPEYDTED